MCFESTMRCMSSLREDLVEKEERRKKVMERIREEEKKGKREEEWKRYEEKEQNETVSAERKCVGFVAAEAF